MEWIETTGRTVAEALDDALDQLGVDEDETEYQILEEPQAGLFGRLRVEARVRARVRPASYTKRRHTGRPRVGRSPIRTIEAIRCLSVDINLGKYEVRLQLKLPPDPLIIDLIKGWTVETPGLVAIIIEEDDLDGDYTVVDDPVLVLVVRDADAAVAATQWFVGVAGPEIMRTAKAMQQTRKEAQHRVSNLLSRRGATPTTYLDH